MTNATVEITTPDGVAVEISRRESGDGVLLVVGHDAVVVHNMLPPVVVEPPIKPPIEPPVDPGPLPPIEPPPVVDSTIPALHNVPLNLALAVAFDDWNTVGQTYTRYQRLTVLKGKTAIAFNGFNSMMQPRALLAPIYRLLMNGVEMAQAVPTGSRGAFVVDVSAMASGWYRLEITGDSGESFLPWFAHVGAGPTRGAPVISGSYDVAHVKVPMFWALIPPGTAPRAVPLTPRETPATAEFPTLADMYRENIVPARDGSIHRLNQTPDGVQTTFNSQAYFFYSLTNRRPTLPSLDGPRNVGVLAMPTHLWVGHQGSTYFTDSWRLGKVAQDGTITTLAGWRHRHPPETGGELSGLELVGDWSQIPEARRGFHELWGVAVDQDSVKTLPDAPPVLGLAPHPAIGPRFFLADSQMNRICLVQFGNGPTALTDPPKVTEFLTGLADPWDCAWLAGSLYVSERKAHRICEYDAVTGALKRVVVSGNGAGLVTWGADRIPRITGSLAQVRAQQCVGPEGLFIQDGWLYFGSRTQAQIRKVNLTTGELREVCSPFVDANSFFMKFCLSDGTFGPRGSVFVSTWTGKFNGLPEVFVAQADGTVTASGLSRAGDAYNGRGGYWASTTYSSSVGCGHGRLMCGSAQEGLAQLSKALPSDPVLNLTQYNKGRTEYLLGGNALIHGHQGYGYHGYPLPWGKSDAMDYYLAWNGHRKESP